MLTLEATLGTVSWSRQNTHSKLGSLAEAAPFSCRMYSHFQSSCMKVFSGSFTALAGKLMGRLVSRSQSMKNASMRLEAVAAVGAVQRPITITLVRLEETQKVGRELNCRENSRQSRRLPLPSSLSPQTEASPVVTSVEVMRMRLPSWQRRVLGSRGGVLLLAVKYRTQLLPAVSRQSSLPLTRLVRLLSAAVQVSSEKSFCMGLQVVGLPVRQKTLLSALRRSQQSDTLHLVEALTATPCAATAACTSATLASAAELPTTWQRLTVLPSPNSLHRSFWKSRSHDPVRVSSDRSMLLGELGLARTTVNLVLLAVASLKVHPNPSVGISVAECGTLKVARGGKTGGSSLAVELRLPQSNSSTSTQLTPAEYPFSTISLLVMELSTKILRKSRSSRVVESSLARRKMIWLPTIWQASSQAGLPAPAKVVLRNTTKQSLKSNSPTRTPLMVVSARAGSWKVTSDTVLRVQSMDFTTMRWVSMAVKQLNPTLVICGDGNTSTRPSHPCTLTISTLPSCRRLAAPSSLRKQIDWSTRQLGQGVEQDVLVILQEVTTSRSRTCLIVQPLPGFTLKTAEQSSVEGLYLYTLACATPYRVDSVMAKALKPGGRVTVVRLSLLSLSRYSTPVPLQSLMKQPALQFSPMTILLVKQLGLMPTMFFTSSGKLARGALAIIATLPLSLLKLSSPNTCWFVSQTMLQERVSLVPSRYRQLPLSTCWQVVQLLGADRLKKLNLKVEIVPELAVPWVIYRSQIRLEVMRRVPTVDSFSRMIMEDVMLGGGTKLGEVWLRDSERIASSKTSLIEWIFIDMLRKYISTFSCSHHLQI